MDILCQVCGEPWDTYHLRHEEPPWVFPLVQRGAGCPECEGEPPEHGPPSFEVLSDAFLSEGDAALEGESSEYLHALIDEERPKWEPPPDRLLVVCECGQDRCYREHGREGEFREFPEEHLRQGTWSITSDDFPSDISRVREAVEASFYVVSSETNKVVDGNPLDLREGTVAVHTDGTVSCEVCGETYREQIEGEEGWISHVQESMGILWLCMKCREDGKGEFCWSCNTILKVGKGEAFFTDQGTYCKVCVCDQDGWDQCSECREPVEEAGEDAFRVSDIDGEEFEDEEGNTLHLSCAGELGIPRALRLITERNAQAHTGSLFG